MHQRPVHSPGRVNGSDEHHYFAKLPPPPAPQKPVICDDCPIGGREGNGPLCSNIAQCDREAREFTEAMARDRGQPCTFGVGGVVRERDGDGRITRFDISEVSIVGGRWSERDGE